MILLLYSVPGFQTILPERRENYLQFHAEIMLEKNSFAEITIFKVDGKLQIFAGNVISDLPGIVVCGA